MFVSSRSVFLEGVQLRFKNIYLDSFTTSLWIKFLPCDWLDDYQTNKWDCSCYHTASGKWINVGDNKRETNRTIQLVYFVLFYFALVEFLSLKTPLKNPY